MPPCARCRREKELLRCQGGDLLPLRRAHNQQATNYCTRIASDFNITD